MKWSNPYWSGQSLIGQCSIWSAFILKMVNMVWVSWSPWSPLPNSDGGVTVAPHCISARERRVLEHQHAFQRIWVTDTYTKPFAMLSTLFSSSQSSDQVTLYPRNPQYDPQRCFETFKLYGEQYPEKEHHSSDGKNKEEEFSSLGVR